MAPRTRSMTGGNAATGSLPQTQRAPRRRYKKYFSDLSYNFFTLPLELRTMVYEFAAAGTEKRQTPDKIITFGRAWSLLPTKRRTHFLRVCKAIYQEYLPVLYSDSKIIVRDWQQFAVILATIGSDGIQMIHHIVMEDCYMPKDVMLNNRRELREVHAGTQVPHVPIALPGLPALKTFTIRFLSEPVTLASVAVYPTTVWPNVKTQSEIFMDKLVQSRPRRGHFVADYMALLNDSPNLEWFIEAKDINLMYQGNGVRFPIRRMSTRIEVRVGKTTVEEEGKLVSYWHFRDNSGSKGSIIVWRCAEEEDDDWKAFRILPS